jgi:hypothetical protein
MFMLFHIYDRAVGDSRLISASQALCLLIIEKGRLAECWRDQTKRVRIYGRS